MKIIPVLDLKKGVVVHAKYGDRQHYQPISSYLCPSAVICDVIDAFLSVYAFDTFYIADLDAITRQGHHDALIAKVVATYPQLCFWVDKGYQRHRTWHGAVNYWPVLGSESYDETTAAELKAFGKRFILSLDYSADGALGAENLFTDTDFWPDNIIVMTLAKVGSGGGPDLQRLGHFCESYPSHNFIAAGGIRDFYDLERLKQIGVQQALVASALHSGAIKRGDIGNL
jgi:phosphoribosylformimino-5-aminoimidazole carboxamide ribotide isomerase